MKEERQNKRDAINLLDNYLSGKNLIFKELFIDKDKLVAMYFESRNVVQQNVEDPQLAKIADSLFYTCINVVSCSVNASSTSKELVINGKSNLLTPKKLFENALVLYSQFKKLNTY